MFNLTTALDYLRFAQQLLNGSRIVNELSAADLRFKDIVASTERQLTVLDLGSGRMQPQYLILSHLGHTVYGVDIANRPAGELRDLLYVLARWLFRRGLKSIRPVTSSPGASALLCSDVAVLPFKSNSFDLVTSVAAFEHFLEIEAVLDELERVLKPGGYAWIAVHLFTCLSGGHNVGRRLDPINSVSGDTEPWDHLRKRKTPFSVPLNEWRLQQYLSAFEKRLQIVKHYCANREGENLLTPEIRNELADYSLDELTCSCYIIVARKRIPK